MVRFDVSGTALWGARVGTEAKGLEQAHDVAIGRDGDLLVFGAGNHAIGPIDDEYGSFFTSLDGTGKLQWTMWYPHATPILDSHSLALDSTGRAFLTTAAQPNVEVGLGVLRRRRPEAALRHAQPVERALRQGRLRSVLRLLDRSRLSECATHAP